MKTFVALTGFVLLLPISRAEDAQPQPKRQRLPNITDISIKTYGPPQLPPSSARERASAAGPGVPLNYSTGFEPSEGFSVGPVVGQPVGPLFPEPWAQTEGSCSGSVEGHIDNVNPAAGSQNLRLSHDPAHPGGGACINVFLPSLAAR